ncbi:MAG: hypothetical protein ACRBBN_15885 [Methyloligellaceae bacterium]
MNYFKNNGLEKKIYAKHEFDLLNAPVKRRIELRRCTLQDISKVCEFTESELPGEVARAEVVRSALGVNKNNILTFWNNNRMVGVWAMLMLNHLGLERILLGEFDSLNPSTKCLSPRLETPMGIYVWAVIAPGIAAEGIRHVSAFLRAPIYRNTNLFTRPNTKAGVRINQGVGFAPVKCGTEGLYRYTRIANRYNPLKAAA